MPHVHSRPPLLRPFHPNPNLVLKAQLAAAQSDFPFCPLSYEETKIHGSPHLIEYPSSTLRSYPGLFPARAQRTNGLPTRRVLACNFAGMSSRFFYSLCRVWRNQELYMKTPPLLPKSPPLSTSRQETPLNEESSRHFLRALSEPETVTNFSPPSLLFSFSNPPQAEAIRMVEPANASPRFCPS